MAPGRPNRAVASSPIPVLHQPLNQRPSASMAPDPTSRSMRLKVLYTFDQDKTNCLARWPHLIPIRTAFLDTNTEIGVIELKTCLQAIATASPEIVAKLGQDYTVYAYDYSEYETPLVGQGMLSWILASSSPDPAAPALQSRTIVTGRVNKSPFGLFAPATAAQQETLEVKLRLVPVPTSLQSEYIESMKKYRDISATLPGNFDPQAWTSFLQANPNFLQQQQQRQHNHQQPQSQPQSQSQSQTHHIPNHSQHLPQASSLQLQSGQDHQSPYQQEYSQGADLEYQPSHQGHQQSHQQPGQQRQSLQMPVPPDFHRQSVCSTSSRSQSPNFAQRPTSRNHQEVEHHRSTTSYKANVSHTLPGDQIQDVNLNCERVYDNSARPRSRAESDMIMSEPGAQFHSIHRQSSPASSIASGTTQAGPKRRGRKPGPNYKGPKQGTKKSGEAASCAVAEPLKDPQPSHSQTQSDRHSTFQCQPQNNMDEEIGEDGAPRKRAKIFQADWSGRQHQFINQPESLRVAASTAASIRIHQPTAVRPGPNSHLTRDSQPRVPTPVAGLGHDQTSATSRKQAPESQYLHSRPAIPKSNLAQETSYSEHSRPRTLSTTFKDDRHTPAPGSSPEKSQSEDGSPFALASSPPEYNANSTAQSSPKLPAFSSAQAFNDSGFMSESIDDLFEDGDNLTKDERIPEHREAASIHPASQPQKDRVAINPTGASIHHAPRDSKAADGAQRTSFPRPALRQSTSSSHAYQNIIAPASDPVKPASLNRSQTWAGQQQQHPASDEAVSRPPIISAATRAAPALKGRRQSDMGGQSGVKRKAAIQHNLKQQIQAGELPPFCDNCGAIETPTWRKAWAKIHSGTPEHVHLSEEDGGIVAWQTLQTDKLGSVCLYRIIKKSLSQTDQGFEDMLLCNPCGIWLYTRKCMRPKEVWDKNANRTDERRRRGNQSNKGTVSEKSQTIDSDRPEKAQADANGVLDNGSSASDLRPGSRSEVPNNTCNNGRVSPILQNRSSKASESGPLGLERNEEGNDVTRLDDVAAAAALKRAIKSSPHRFQGSRVMPIDITDLTPQPTRRLLFPSPKQLMQAQSKSSSPTASNKEGESTRQHASPDLEAASQAIDQAGMKHGSKAEQDWHSNTSQENNTEMKIRNNTTENASSSTHDASEYVSKTVDDFERFFDGKAAAMPSTPSRSSHQNLSFRTPARTPRQINPSTADFFSSAARALFRASLTPKRSPSCSLGPGAMMPLSPFSAQLNQVMDHGLQGHDGPGKTHTQRSCGDKRLQHEFLDIHDENNIDDTHNDFAFPTLPSLRNTPTSAAAHLLSFDFANFDSQDLISTDLAMPSSPPTSWNLSFENYGFPSESPIGQNTIDIISTTSACTKSYADSCKNRFSDASGQNGNNLSTMGKSVTADPGRVIDLDE